MARLELVVPDCVIGCHVVKELSQQINRGNFSLRRIDSITSPHKGIGVLVVDGSPNIRLIGFYFAGIVTRPKCNVGNGGVGATDKIGPCTPDIINCKRRKRQDE